MIGIETNRPDFFNDISEEIRLFLGLVDIKLQEGEEQLADYIQINLYKENGEWHTQGKAHFEDYGDAVYSLCMAADKTESPLQEKKYAKRAVKITAFRLMRKLFPNAYVPWGSLTGIRPSKLMRDLISDHGMTEALRIMQEDFDVQQDKLDLALNTVQTQGKLIESVDPCDVDVYVGIPYCKTRCLYCSFASEVLHAKVDKLTPYLSVLYRDIQLGAQLVKQGNYKPRNLYIGGGTPTVLTAEQLQTLFEHLKAAYGVFGEITVEAGRPDTLNKEKLQVMKAAGVGRISINPQSMNDATLERIGRSHMAKEVEEIYEQARQIGFDCINMDIIAGLPGEGIDDFAKTISDIERLKPDNLTVHTLAIKRSSRLKERLNEYPCASAEVVGEMLEMAAACAQRLDMKPYYMYRQKYMNGNLENVGYAVAMKECAYNVDMMEETTNILAHGAGAMTKRVFGGQNRVERIPAPKNIETYMQKLDLLHAKKLELFC